MRRLAQKILIQKIFCSRYQVMKEGKSINQSNNILKCFSLDTGIYALIWSMLGLMFNNIQYSLCLQRLWSSEGGSHPIFCVMSLLGIFTVAVLSQLQHKCCLISQTFCRDSRSQNKINREMEYLGIFHMTQNLQIFHCLQRKAAFLFVFFWKFNQKSWNNLYKNVKLTDHKC